MTSRNDLSTLALERKLPPVPEVTISDAEHARHVVVERVYGLGGLPGIGEGDPAEATRDILGALGLLPNQPQPKSTIKHGQWMRMQREKESDATA